MDVDDRTEAALTAGEREQLEAFLHDNRVEIAKLLDGLTEEQARRRLVPSLTTLLGLVKHAAFAERVWFDVALSRRTRAEVGSLDSVDQSSRSRRTTPSTPSWPGTSGTATPFGSRSC